MFHLMSRTAILMSVKRPKAEVARRQWQFRFVPIVLQMSLPCPAMIYVVHAL